MSWSFLENLKRAWTVPDGESPDSARRHTATSRDPALELEECGRADAAEGRCEQALRALRGAADLYEAEGRMLSAIAVYGQMMKLRPGDPELIDRIDDVAGGSALVPDEEFNTEGPVTASPCQRRKAPLFSELDADSLVEVLGALEVRRLAAGDRLYLQGERCDALHLVISGEIALTRGGTRCGTGSIETGRVHDGEIAGLLSRTPVDLRPEGALASRASRVLTLRLDMLEEVLERRPHVWRVIDEFQALALAPALVEA